MKCKGPNCKSDGKTPHSSECRFEYAANVASGVKGFTMQKENSHLAVLEELAKEVRGHQRVSEYVHTRGVAKDFAESCVTTQRSSGRADQMSKELEAIVAEMRARRPFARYEMADELESWANRLEALSTQAGEGWRDIATAPKDGSFFIVYTRTKVQEIVRWDEGEETFMTPASEFVYPHWATNWCPLPPPPSPPSDTKGA